MEKLSKEQTAKLIQKKIQGIKSWIDKLFTRAQHYFTNSLIDVSLTNSLLTDISN